MTEPITLPLAQVHGVIKPRHMHEGYSSRVCVCLSDCVSVTALVATYLVYMSKVRWHAVSCRLLKIYIGLFHFISIHPPLRRVNYVLRGCLALVLWGTGKKIIRS